MFDLLYKSGMIEVIENETTVARIFPQKDYVLVKMMNGFDFSIGTQEIALQIIKNRLESEKI